MPLETEVLKKETTMDYVVAQKESKPLEACLQKIEDVGNKDGHIVDIDKWADSLARKLEEVPQYMCRPGHPGRISRIPDSLREIDVKSYEPYFLSIGPYHHGKLSLQDMERTKQCVLKWVLEHIPELTVKDFLMEIGSIELLARSFYSDVEMESEEFVRMLLLDSLYIVTMFCGPPRTQERMNPTNIKTDSTEKNIDLTQSEDDRQMMARVRESDFGMRSSEINMEGTDEPRWLWILLEHDLFLLENQLPIFVLNRIHKLVYGGSETQLIGCIKDEFCKFFRNYNLMNVEMVISPTKEVHHLLHLCHMFFRPSPQQESTIGQLPESGLMFRLGSAIQLYEEGVRFEARMGSTNTLLDITVDNHGKMCMPCLCVEDNTVSLLRNLIAFEQMKYPSMGLDVSAYAVFLLHLITVPGDVKLLRRKGIIHHHLASDKEMVQLVNKLSVGLSFDYVEDKYYLKPVFHELKRYSERRVPKWRAWLKHRYFDNPWTAISLFAASLLLLLTFVQTYYSVYSFYNPR